MTARTVFLFALALSLAWVAGGSMYFMADVRTDFEVQHHLARIEQTHAFVIPIDCPNARGLEIREFVRDHSKTDKCWVDILGFRRLYPDIAAATDIAATVHFNAPSELPVQGQGGTAAEALLRAAAVIIGGPVIAVLVALSYVG